MHTQRIVVLICGVLGALVTFLPWATVPIIGTISGTVGDGWITLALFLPAVGLVLAGDRARPLAGGARLGAVIPAALASALGVWKIIDFNSAMQAPEDNPFAEALSAGVSVGAGLYLVALMGVAIAISSFVLGADTRAAQ